MCEIDALKRGSQAAWSDLQEKYFQRIYFFVRRQVSDHQACEDIVQDTFLGAVRGIDRFDEQYSIEQFLFGIARNKLIDHLRRRRGEVSLSAAGPDDSYPMLEATFPSNAQPPSRLVRDDERMGREKRVLVRILRRLVEKFWRKRDFRKLMTMELIFLKNLPYRQIATELGLRDEKAVAGIKFQAIQDLQRFAMQEDPRHSLFSGLWRERGHLS